MRITQGALTRSMLGDLGNAQELLAGTQRRISSQKRVEKPSDCAPATRELLAVKSQIKETEQYNTNIAGAMLTMGEADSAIGAMSDILREIKELALQSEGVSSDNTRIILATKVENLIKNMAEQGNTMSGGEYLFTGMETSSVPFTTTYGPDPDGAVRSQFVRYSGGIVAPAMDIASGEKAEVSCTGADIAGPGPGGVFGTVLDIRRAILTGAPTGGLQDQLTEHMDRLDGIQADLGCRQQYLAAVRDRYTKSLTDLEVRRSVMEDVDLSSEALMNTNAETAYNATLSVVGKHGRNSLADYL